MTREEAKQLMKKYTSGACTPEEKLLIESWYLDIIDIAGKEDIPENLDEIGAEIWAGIQPARKPGFRYWRMAAAAVLVFAIGGATLYLKHQQTNQQNTTQRIAVTDMQPGGNKAILTLANGEKIDLDKAQNGTLSNRAGVNIRKTTNSMVVYQSSANTATNNQKERESYNTISTPNGGQFEIVLEDGTKVWLNAGTTMTYPVSFAHEHERRIKLNGEAYFEVTKNPIKRFIVESTTQTVIVLGTHFNVSCYSNEAVKTTLAEGKIEISQSANPQRTTLKPGEQAIVNPDGLKVHQVNPEEFIAWKDGKFVFSRTPLKAVLRQISRWYNADVDFSQIPDLEFDGQISRQLTLQEVLKRLEVGSGLQFRLEGRRITREK